LTAAPGLAPSAPSEGGPPPSTGAGALGPAVLRDHPRLAVVVATVGLAFTGILFVLSGESPTTATVFRCLYALPFLVILARREDRALGPRPWAARRWAFLAGVAFAVDLVLFHHGILLVGAGLSTVLSNLQVVIVLVAAWLLWGERPATAQLAGVPVALAGVVLISGVVGRDAYGRDPALGVVVGIVVASAYASYLLLIRKGRDRSRFAGPILDATLACALVAALAGAVAGDLDLVPRLPGHAWLFLLAISGQAMAGLLLAIALPRMPALTTSLLLLVQPVLTVVLSIVLIGEAPSILQLAGVGLVVVGVALGSVPWGRMSPRARARPEPVG
jgi:drug/metabolite transporter (DMT)-like permease